MPPEDPNNPGLNTKNPDLSSVPLPESTPIKSPYAPVGGTLGDVADDLVSRISVALEVAYYRKVVEGLVDLLEVLIVHRAAADDAGIREAGVQKALVDPGDECPEDVAAAHMKPGRRGRGLCLNGIDIVLVKGNAYAVPEFLVAEILS